MMGILSGSSRIDVEIGDNPKAFNKALKIIQDNHGDIINIGMTAHRTDKRVYYFRLSTCDTGKICNAFEKNGFTVVETMG
jgi:hypothetical protein